MVLWRILLYGLMTVSPEFNNSLIILKNLFHQSLCGSLVFSTPCLTWLLLSNSLQELNNLLWITWLSTPVLPTGLLKKKLPRHLKKVNTSMVSSCKELHGRRDVDKMRVTSWIWSLKSLLLSSLLCMSLLFWHLNTAPPVIISALHTLPLAEDLQTTSPLCTWNSSLRRLTQEDGHSLDVHLSCNPSEENSDLSQTLV